MVTGAASTPFLSSQAPPHPTKPSIPPAPGAGRLCTCKRPSPPEHLSYGPRGSSAPASAARAQSPGPAVGSSPPCGHGDSHAGVCRRSQRLWSRLPRAMHSSFHSTNLGDASALCSARRRLWDQGRDGRLHPPGACCRQQKGEFPPRIVRTLTGAANRGRARVHALPLDST